ncbi:hypothetical protein [Streptomyces sp. NPDC086787]|uniref:hypothetical protein n=1 Tax=Streptomyces sp. NPDC086787 TaxID=3365759 RepID=UPI003827DEB9
MRISRAHRPAAIRAAGILLIVTGLGAGPLAAAGPAFADGVTVGQLTTGHDGRLSVALSAGGEALWVKVSVRASAAPDAAVLASTDDLTYSVQGDWSTERVLSLPQGTAYGDYPVDIDYRMPGGTVQHWEGAEHGVSGLFHYRLHTDIAKVGFDRASIDYDHREVVLSGTATVFDPATGNTRPADAGTRVRVAWSSFRDGTWYRPSETVVTDASGAFELKIASGGTVQYGTIAVLPAEGTVPGPARELPSVDVVPLTYRITGEASNTRVHSGKTFTMSGGVQRLGPDGWVPFAGAPVVTTDRRPDAWDHNLTGVMGRGTSAADGSFSYDVTATYTTHHYTFVAPSDYLREAGSVQDDVTVPRAAKLDKVRIGLDAYGAVTATGHLLPDWTCADQSVSLQYSANGRSGWQNVASAKAEGGTAGYCPFTVRGRAPRDSGYYRLAHTESPTLLGVTSPVVKLARVATRFASFDMTPNAPRLNGPLTAKGTVQYKSGAKWVAYKGANVTVLFRPKGESEWYWTVKGKTDSHGRFSLKTKAYQDGTWAVVYAPDAKHFYSESKTEYVNAR